MISRTEKNPNLIAGIIIAGNCIRDLEDGRCLSIVELAKKYQRDRSYISKIMKLQFLSPKIKALILEGNQPRSLTMQSLIKIANHLNWKTQENALGL